MPQPLTVTEKLVLFKADLLDIQKILSSKLSDQAKHKAILELIDEELNYPSEQDKDSLLRMRDRILKHSR
jgi:hypothetical protein